MPEVRETEVYERYAQMDVPSLHARIAELREQAGGKFTQLPDDKLIELIAATRALRKKAAAPGGAGKAKTPRAPKEKPTLESLA